jgi:hypothetical protein
MKHISGIALITSKTRAEESIKGSMMFSIGAGIIIVGLALLLILGVMKWI